MFILNSFGSAAIQILGPIPFLTFYFGASLISNSISHVYFKFLLPSFQNQTWYSQRNPGNSLGASGAVNATSALFALTYPNAPLLIMGIVPIQAIQAVGLFFAYDIYKAYTAGPNNSVKHL